MQLNNQTAQSPTVLFSITSAIFKLVNSQVKVHLEQVQRCKWYCYTERMSIFHALRPFPFNK